MPISPEDQFQIGDFVLYIEEGVYARAVGYEWVQTVGSPPKIVGYVLDCGSCLERQLGR